MNTQTPPHPTPDVMLSELASLGMRGARVVARMMEIEQAAAEVAARWLPEASAEPASLGEAVASGQGVDAVAAAMEQAVPRVEVLARALDRLSRAVRRSVALMRRMEAGWPRAGVSDNRAAMVRRQVARGVAEVIRRESEGEAAERLFDDLAERLSDPAIEAEIDVMPIEESVRRICRDLNLASTARQHPGVKRTTVLLQDPAVERTPRPDNGRLWQAAGQGPASTPDTC